MMPAFEILNRLNRKLDPISWFNIAGYIRYIKPRLSRADNETYNRKLYEAITGEIFFLIDNIFTALITKGVLSVLKPNKYLTDKYYVPRERKPIYEKIKDDPEYSAENSVYGNNCFYYLTELPYKHDSNLLFSNKENIGNKTGWFTLYALDWISQIGFCHKFINQRISYITGATGVGKSTQVPKLYMYYLKAIDYLSNGKVVCTQPRQAPTRKNAETVSKELGLPIFDVSGMKDIDTNNYYVQMKFKNKQHIANVNHLSLKYLTDGTLVQELTDISPLFKRYIPSKSEDRQIANANLYDVIIIDEAHEHGKNMDVLLTIMRDYCYFNPSLRLVILSATMDDDEPVYRRYYRDINDNKRSPIDTRIRDLGLDRINIDRRFHISPPGYGTNFPIEEIYRPQGDVYDTVREIIKDGMKGSILIFQPGEADIVELVSKLNEETPANVLAIPFYSSLKDDKKKLIEDIDTKYSKIRLSKNENLDLDSQNYL